MPFGIPPELAFSFAGIPSISRRKRGRGGKEAKASWTLPGVTTSATVPVRSKYSNVHETMGDVLYAPNGCGKTFRVKCGESKGVASFRDCLAFDEDEAVELGLLRLRRMVDSTAEAPV
jgi:hypothetical protein